MLRTQASRCKPFNAIPSPPFPPPVRHSAHLAWAPTIQQAAVKRTSAPCT